MEKPQSG